MSRHHFLQPENFKPSQFRIRAPKKDYKNIYPKHLSISSQYLSNKNEYSYEQENDKYEENYGYEQKDHRYEKENNMYEENFKYKQVNNRYKKNYTYEQKTIGMNRKVNLD
jgi:hypothetical protein